MLEYCVFCNTGFEVLQVRCPVCRHTRKQQRRIERKKAGKQRRKISKSMRRRIYVRDGFACLACGSKKKLTLDHIVPLSKGGTNDESNLQTLCEHCNCSVKRGKSTSYPPIAEAAY